MTVLALILVLVVLPALVGYCFYLEGFWIDFDPASPRSYRSFFHNLIHNGLEPGDFLIYRKPKVSPHPGPRARNVQASEKGDDYYYEVEKYWTLADVREDGKLIAVTRTGKQVQLQPEDEHLRKAGILDRVLHRNRFPSI
jgi:hypothetical protein